MTNINPVGIDLSTGQFRPLKSSDFASDASANPLQGATGLPGVTGIASGATGIKGQAGLTGIHGITGIRPQGIQGITGGFLAGATGLTGQTGLEASVGGTTGLQGAGPYTLLTGATTIASQSYIIGLDSSGGSFTVTIPLIGLQGPPGKVFVFQDESGQADVNPVTLSAPDNAFHYDSADYIINKPYQAVEILNEGGTYFIYEFNIGYTGIQGFTGLSAGA